MQVKNIIEIKKKKKKFDERKKKSNTIAAFTFGSEYSKDKKRSGN